MLLDGRLVVPMLAAVYGLIIFNGGCDKQSIILCLIGTYWHLLSTVLSKSKADKKILELEQQLRVEPKILAVQSQQTDSQFNFTDPISTQTETVEVLEQGTDPERPCTCRVPAEGETTQPGLQLLS